MRLYHEAKQQVWDPRLLAYSQPASPEDDRVRPVLAWVRGLSAASPIYRAGLFQLPPSAL